MNLQALLSVCRGIQIKSEHSWVKAFYYVSYITRMLNYRVWNALCQEASMLLSKSQRLLNTTHTGHHEHTSPTVVAWWTRHNAVIAWCMEWNTSWYNRMNTAKWWPEWHTTYIRHCWCVNVATDTQQVCRRNVCAPNVPYNTPRICMLS